MAQYSFGSGMLWATPQTDALGNVIANPTPIMIGVMQEGSIDINFENKTLHGQNQFPVAVGRGKGKIGGKAKFAQLFGAMFNNVLFGQTLRGGLVSVHYDTSGVVIPGAPIALGVSPPGSGVFSRDMGVINDKGLPMRCLSRSQAIEPAAGMGSCYSVTPDGTYRFSPDDTGKTMFINYEYTVAEASAGSATQSTVMNLPMGAAPTFSADLFLPYQGKSMKLSLFCCVASKLALATKQDDFLVPDFDFDAFADPVGRVLHYSLSE